MPNEYEESPSLSSVEILHFTTVPFRMTEVLESCPFVIPSEADRPTRNPGLFYEGFFKAKPFRMTLHYKGSTPLVFPNVCRNPRLCSSMRFFLPAIVRMTSMSSRTYVRDLIQSALFSKRFFGVIPLRMTLHHKVCNVCHSKPRP